MEELPIENSEYLVDGKYEISDLLDLDRLQGIFDKFTLATGFTIGFLDHPGLNILANSGWRDICTKFHRGVDASAEICTKSNRILLNALNQPDKTIIQSCEHGMIDCAIPIFIKGIHIASLATGQLLLEPPDIERFKKQARTYGYDEAAYLEALKEIPVVSEKDLNNVTIFMGEIASLISEMGYSSLHIKEKSEKLETEIAEHKRLESELTESEERYASLFRGAIEGILAADVETKKFVFANPSICKMLGYTSEELLTLGVQDIHPADTIEFVLGTFDELVKGEKNAPAEIPCRKKDGSILYANINSNRIKINNREVIVGFFTDITERRNAEGNLRETNELVSLFMKNSPIYTYIKEVTPTESVVVMASENFKDMVGIPGSEMSGKSMRELFPPEIAEKFITDDWNVVNEGKVINIDEVLNNRSYTTIKFPITVAGIKLLAGYTIDVTENKKAETALRESENRYRTLFTTSPSGILVLDENGIILDANEEVYKSVIYSPDEFIGQHVTKLSTPDNLPVVNENIRRILSGEVIEQEVVNITKDGTYRVYILKETAITLSNGRQGILSVSTDITERKKAEDIIKQKSNEIEDQNEEYRQINIELQKAKEKAEESDRLKSAFLANMSHEIRTPMNGILSFAGLLQSPELTSEKQKEYVRIIERSGDRMLNIINDLISISKIEAGMTEVILSNSSINEQIEYIYYFFKPEVEKKGMQLFYKNALPLKQSIIYTDREKIYAILTNLVKNAIKFTREGSIEFGYNLKDDYLEFFVKDTGIGISDEQKEFIFERFRQGSESLSRNYEGAGLGLSISKLYVEMLGGKIWVESEPFLGTTFHFTTPYITKTDDRIRDKVDFKTDHTKEKIQNLKILIAEDDDDSDKFLTLTLEKFNPVIFHALTGIEAIEICRDNPDMNLVLMDIKMAEMDGYEATRQIRQFNKDIIIIAQTAYAIIGDREKAINAGCDDHITKPIRAQRLLDVISKYFSLE